MSDIILKNEGGKHFPPIESGSYRANCYGIVCIGTTFSQVYSKSFTKIIFLWELPDEQIEIDGKMMPRGLSQTYTMSLNEKSNLRKMLEGWRGRAFTQDELNGFSLRKILGAPCLLSVIIGQKDNGDTYNKVNGVARLPKGMEAAAPVNLQVLFNVMDVDQPLSEMSTLPEWIQQRIMESDEYKSRLAEMNNQANIAPPAEVDPGDDLPF